MIKNVIIQREWLIKNCIDLLIKLNIFFNSQNIKKAKLNSLWNRLIKLLKIAKQRFFTLFVESKYFMV
jgi:hypothetical protein